MLICFSQKRGCGVDVGQLRGLLQSSAEANGHLRNSLAKEEIMRFGDELAWKVWQALCKAVPDELKVSGEKHSEEHKKGALTIALVISELADRFQRICSEEGVLHAVLYIRNILSRLHAKVARLTCLDQPDAVFAGIIDELPVDMECVEASLEALDECSGQKESEA